jgi:hypothetical protein
MDFDDDLGELVDEALGKGGIGIAEVIRALQVKLSAVKELEREGERAGALSGLDLAFVGEDDDHDDRDWE